MAHALATVAAYKVAIRLAPADAACHPLSSWMLMVCRQLADVVIPATVAGGFCTTRKLAR